jgi:hypothetical protein
MRSNSPIKMRIDTNPKAVQFSNPASPALGSSYPPPVGGQRKS